MSGTLREKLEAIAAARFDAIELFENDLIYFNGAPSEVRSIAGDLGLGIDLYQPFRDFEGVSEALFRKNVDRAERKFDVMQALGVPMMLVCSNVSPHVIADDELAAEQLYELAERAARRNLRIGYEALAWGKRVMYFSHAWDIVRRADHPHLGLIVDSFHSLSLGDDPAGIADIPGDKLFFVQLADAPLLRMDVMQWGRRYRCFPGQGQFDLPNFLEQVLVAGYTGPISLEVFNDIFKETPNRRTAIDAMRSLLFLEGQVRARLERSTGGATPVKASRGHVLDRVELFDPPAAPVLSGFAFLEFAVDEESGRALGALLEAFGFRRAGRHRSKAATLYRQGDAYCVVNAEPTSDARSHFLKHGPSVCAIGLRTDDPVRALNRATALYSVRYDSPVGPNELHIPAIRAPDGSLVYFVAAQLGSKGPFEIDFEIDADKTDPDADGGLESVDHIALGLSNDQLDTWVLFCRAILGLHRGESLELADPYGVIRTSGLSSDDKSVRVVLNVSVSQSTLTARTVSALAGASVHHIGVDCKDIFETVEKLRANGVSFVPISPNYYDDLVTRFDIDPGVVKRLRALGILYDRSGGGEYFHIYADMFAERFFFELVQRIGGYDGYGAMNAAARMASQAQSPPGGLSAGYR